MKSNAIITVILAAILIIPASAAIINIPYDYANIQAGINASFDGDTVLVQPGVYIENIDFNGHEITVGSLFLTTNDTQYIATTIIDGNSTGSVVTFEISESVAAVLTGFTLQNGNADCGGGIYCSNSSPTIMNNKIQNCRASSADYPDGGGGIYCYYASPVITNNTISENLAYRFGGGIYCHNYSSPRINNNILTQNLAYVNGSGILCSNSSSPLISHNSISGNLSNGIHCHSGSDPIIINNTFDSNTGPGITLNISSPLIIKNVITGNGSTGIFINYNSFPTITNNTITENSCGIGINSLCATEVLNNIIWGNSQSVSVSDNCIITITYTNIEGGWDGEGNIDINPLFRDPENGDFHLMATYCGDPYDSPCIDMGHPDLLDSLLDCDWGLGELRSDMGAYGGTDSVIVGIDELIAKLPARFALLQNYPNPFNAMTIIEYSLTKPACVTIDIYDMLGREVETLVSEQQQAGYHSITWNASDQTSGMYFYKIQAGDFTETKKMLLLK